MILGSSALGSHGLGSHGGAHVVVPQFVRVITRAFSAPQMISKAYEAS